MPSTGVLRVLVVALLFAAGLLCGASTAQAQLQNSGKRPWVVIKGSLSDFTGKSDTIVADFDSEEAAKEEAQRLNEALRGDEAFRWVYTVGERKQEEGALIDQGQDLLTRLKEAKAAVDRAKRIEKGEESLLQAKERKLGDTVKEYRDRLKESLRQATEAKKTLTGGVAALTDAKMREVNGLVDRYNRELQDFGAVMGQESGSGFGPLQRVQPPPAEELEIAGRWRTATNEWEFGADGSFQIVGTRNRGQWKKTAGGIAVKYSGASVWIDLTFVGESLVDQKGFIGKARLTKQPR